MRSFSLFHSNKGNQIKKFKVLRSYTSVSNEENTSKPIYPPILDVSEKSQQQRNALEMHSKIQNLNTVEEKLLSLNVPRYYGWESLLIKEGNVPYNFLPFVKCVTRTKLHQVEKVPVEIALTELNFTQLINDIKKKLESIIVLHSQSQRFKYEFQLDNGKHISENEISSTVGNNLVTQINRIFTSHLASNYHHLLSCQIDYEPRIEGFWNVGDFNLTEKERKKREDKKVSEKLLDLPISRWIQYFGSPILQIRNALPLKALGSVNTTQTFDYEEFPYCPATTYALDVKRYHGATIPGFWPNDEYKYGLVSFHTRQSKICVPNFEEDEHEEALHAQAILACFASLLGQASYNGFTTFNDVTYPLISQNILSDGKLFSFYNYQMNTCVTFTDNKKRNDCYTTGSMELYHDIQDNQIKGWNNKVLEALVTMYLNVPKERQGVDMQPYLKKDESLIEHIELEKKRIWLHDKYRWFTSHRKRSTLDPEIFDWEYIYKVAFPTRPMDAKRRFFDLDEDPLEERRMGDKRERRYIPKALRPETEMKKKYVDKFYPDV